MIFITTALMAEARPLIKQYNLKRADELNKVSLWQNKDFLLCITGVGKVKAAIHTSIVCSYYHSQIDFAVNFGMAGATFTTTKGHLYRANKISDAHSGSSWYPDMALHSNLPEAEVKTFDHPVTSVNRCRSFKGLVEMEAAGFFEAAGIYLSTSRLACLKIVSDFLQNAPLDKEEILEFTTQNLADITAFLQRADQFCKAYMPGSFSHTEIDLLEKVHGNLNLTITQKRQLTKSARYRKIKYDDLTELLKPYLDKKAEHKHHRKELFESLQNSLHTL